MEDRQRWQMQLRISSGERPGVWPKEASDLRSQGQSRAGSSGCTEGHGFQASPCGPPIKMASKTRMKPEALEWSEARAS